jgi:sigma-E factor negative regulatory protein RseA
MVMDKISAFMDGESAPVETQQAIKRLHDDDECRKRWDSFHLVGDVMRGDPVLRDDFVERLRLRMAEEPTVLAPRARWRATTRFAYSAAAALAGVAVVLTLVLTDNPLRPAGDIASAGKRNETVQVARSAESGPRIQPPSAPNSAQVNEYLMAHQEFSPRTALQGVVPYVRSVSESHDGNRR